MSDEKTDGISSESVMHSHEHDGLEHAHTHENGGHEHEPPHTHEAGHPHTHEHNGQESEAGHNHVHTHRQTKAVLNRLSRINGHLNAVRRMVEDGRDCPDVLIQLAAVRSAIDGVCKIILKDHIDHCIVDAVETGDMSAVEALNKAIEILMK